MKEYFFSSEFSYLHKLTHRPQHNETALHRHEQYELYYLISGNVELVTQEGKSLLFPGALVLLPPGLQHRFVVLSELPYERVVINLPQLPQAVDEKLFAGIRLIDVQKNNRLLAVMERLQDYNRLFDGQRREYLLGALITELLLLLQKTAVPVEMDQGYGKMMSRALAYIEQHITEIEDVDELCRALSVSRAWLYREFEAALGISPKRYINHRRLEIARHLLGLGEDATKVALRCGYRDYSAFYRAYRTRYGHSPQQTVYYQGQGNTL